MYVYRPIFDANLYEENMSNEIMAQYYKAIKDSENSMHEESIRQSSFDNEAEKSLNDSANELLEAINNSESIAPTQKRQKSRIENSGTLVEFDLIPDRASPTESKREQFMMKEESNNNNIDISKKSVEKEIKTKLKADLLKDINKIGFNDMPESDKSNKNTLKITCHNLKYIAIQNTKSFIIGSTEMKINIIRDYHRNVEKVKAQYARLSSIRAPLGKPTVFQGFDSSLDSETSTDMVENPNEDASKLPTYISRSGRITKRKIFSYEEQDDSSQDSISSANHDKNNEEWLIKGNVKITKPSNKKCNFGENNKENCTNRSQKLKTKRSESPESTVSSEELTLRGFLDKKDPDAFDKPMGDSIGSIIESPKPQQKKRVSNNESISGSPLLKGSPRNSRTNALLNAAKQVTEKQKRQENEIERFKNSLEVEVQSLETEPDQFVNDENVVEKRRIIPPLPGRRPVNGRKRNADSAVNPLESLNIVTKKPHLNISDVSKVTSVNGSAKKAASVKKPAHSPKAAISKRNANMTPCPLCSVSFPSREIEEHAATCGEEMFPQAVYTQRISCQICDCVIMSNKDLEAHVRVCKGKRNLLK
ncbi:uncharacterized protein LOC126736461 isoform X2 [Anthonomus grandis grandis]|uniref:uncharacterized protein LOC126736461 isoform X2 n=1 Tax=Anthonomus grandis grandis TaxID=2921223 RepID=UPI0021665D01|nr:uncharacterized protein LOC126736461 isoform X2 [Anthonomus grandis grandis]